MNLQWDWSDLTGLVERWREPDLRPVEATMHAALTDAANLWESAAYGIQLPGMTRTVHDPAYAASITMRQEGQLSGVVASSDPMRDARAQDDQPPWDMKPGLLHGPKSRETQPRRGDPVHRFNIIPMRHRAGNVSQEALWALLNNVRNFQPRDVPRPAKFTPAGVYVHRAAREAGIRLGRGGPVTFRTVSDRSPAASWWYPARVANPIADAVWNLLEAETEAALWAAWAAALGVGNAPTG